MGAWGQAVTAHCGVDAAGEPLQTLPLGGMGSGGDCTLWGVGAAGEPLHSDKFMAVSALPSSPGLVEQHRATIPTSSWPQRGRFISRPRKGRAAPGWHSQEGRARASHPLFVFLSYAGTHCWIMAVVATCGHAVGMLRPLAAPACVLCHPLGVLLALGRQPLARFPVLILAFSVTCAYDPSPCSYQSLPEFLFFLKDDHSLSHRDSL